MGGYITFDGSPTSQGILQFDIWSATPGLFVVFNEGLFVGSIPILEVADAAAYS